MNQATEGSARLRPLIVLLGLATVMLLGLGAGTAQAAACDTTWNGSNGDWSNAADWDHGVPDGAKVACLTTAGTYTVTVNGESVAAKSLQLGAATGTQTLQLTGLNNGTSQLAELDLTDGGTIGANGDLQLTTSCTLPLCATGAPVSLINGGVTPLTNEGMIESDLGSDAGSNQRTILGNLTNQGTITLNAPLSYQPSGTNGTLINDTGGMITNGGGSSAVTLAHGTTFNEGAGSTSPSSAAPANPAVILDDPAFLTPPTLHYTGTGASTIELRDSTNLAGNVASGQHLVIHGGSGGPCPEAVATASAAFTSAGTITLDGCGAELALTSGIVTNQGTINAVATQNNAIGAQLTNSGTLDINGPTVIDETTGSTTQTAGTTSIFGGQTLQFTSGPDTLFLTGGVLNSPGSSTSSPGILSGSLNNSGGNVIPGTSASPGDLAVDGSYTQGSGGTLTAPLHGTDPGNTYSQLGVIGDMSIAGRLVLIPLPGFTPSPGDDFTVLGSQTGNLTGTFSTLNRFPAEKAFPPGWTYGFQPFYGPHAASVAADGAAGLRVRKAGPGLGTVSSSPAGIHNCGGQCDAPFFSTQTVTLTEHPGAGWAFNGWSGACSGFTTTCHVAMSQARTVTATFAHGTTTTLRSSANPSKVGRKVTYTATVSPHPSGGTVRFTSGGSPISGCGAKAVNASTGKATCAVKYRSKGTRRIQAAYSGNPSFVPSTSSVLTETIRKR